MKISKIQILLFVFVIVLQLTSVNNAKTPTHAAKPNVLIVQETPGTRFKGQVAKAKFEMILWREGKTLKGNYYYLKSGSDNALELSGKIDESGEFTLQEFDRSGKQTGEFTGVWRDEPDQSGIELSGEWKKPTDKQGISFSAAEQLIGFTNGTKISTISFGEAIDAKRFETSVAYPHLINGGANAANFNQAVKAVVDKKVFDFNKLMLARTADELKSLPAGVNNYLDLNFNVEHADNDLISVNFVESTYTGGAHPNTFFFTLNYDLKNGKMLKLADLFKPGSNYLGVLSAYCTKNLQSRTDGSENLGLAQDLWEDGAEPTTENYQSWNATRKGLLISFNPYQVGSYAAGPQFVMIPYAELKNILKSGGGLTK